jgi:hypothetical protein
MPTPSAGRSQRLAFAKRKAAKVRAQRAPLTAIQREAYVPAQATAGLRKEEPPNDHTFGDFVDAK